MTILTVLEQDEKKKEAAIARNILLGLIQADQYVGDVYSIGYESANVQIHDFHRAKVGGIPSLYFLIATRISPDASELDYKLEDSSAILLRVMDSSPLPGHAEAERVRVEVAQKVSGEPSKNWDESTNMDAATHHLLSFAGVECRVIGTFFVDWSERLKSLVLRFGSDLSNYYPNKGLKVFKPNELALARIVNYLDMDRVDETQSAMRVVLGDVRYASTNRAFQGISNVAVEIAPADLLGQKTALFGMTRTGKSNTTKVILKSVFGLRFALDKPRRIGQIVFDPNGEYANENTQDANQQKNPTAIKNVWRSFPAGKEADVVTYGILKHPSDPNRRLMLLNFYEDENLQIGKEIIDSFLAQDSSKFIQNFRQVIFEKPPKDDWSATTRYNRRALAYRALLAKAGFDVPANITPATAKIFNKDLLEKIEQSNEAACTSAASILRLKQPTWKQLALALDALADFIHTACPAKVRLSYKALRSVAAVVDACACATPGHKDSSPFTSATTLNMNMADHAARRLERLAWMPKSSAWFWKRWPQTRSPWLWRRSNNWNRNMKPCASSGNFGWNVPGMKPHGRVANMTPSNRRIA